MWPRCPSVRQVRRCPFINQPKRHRLVNLRFTLTLTAEYVIAHLQDRASTSTLLDIYKAVGLSSLESNKTGVLLLKYCSLAQHEALRQVAAPIGEHLVLARELVRVAVGRVALLRHNLLRVCGNVD